MENPLNQNQLFFWEFNSNRVVSCPILLISLKDHIFSAQQNAKMVWLWKPKNPVFANDGILSGSPGQDRWSGLQCEADGISTWWEPWFSNRTLAPCCFLYSGGGEKARRLHTSRGKLLPRERIDRLLDPGYEHILPALTESALMVDFIQILHELLKPLGQICTWKKAENDLPGIIFQDSFFRVLPVCSLWVVRKRRGPSRRDHYWDRTGFRVRHTFTILPCKATRPCVISTVWFYVFILTCISKGETFEFVAWFC